MGFLPLYGLALSIAFAFLWQRQRRSAQRLGRAGSQSAGYALLIFLVFTLMSFFATWAQYWSLLERIERGDGETLEGVVSEFHPSSGGRTPERFRIGNREFSYGRYQTQQGFHTLREDGGPITEGVKARILYFHEHILRLEIEPASTRRRSSACWPCSFAFHMPTQHPRMPSIAGRPRGRPSKPLRDLRGRPSWRPAIEGRF